MELKLIFIFIRRWIWLLALGLILGAIASYVGSSYQTPVFQASTKIMVMQGPESGVSNLTSLSDQELIRTYIELLTTRPVLEKTGQQLGFTVASGQISARQIPGTRLMEVTVRDSDPQRATLIANRIVEILIEQNETLQASRFSASEESYQAQIAQIEEQMALLQEDEALRSEETLGALQQQLEDQRQELEDEILSIQSQKNALELEIETLTSQPASGDLPPQLEAQRQELEDEILSIQSQMNTLDLEIEDLIPQAAPGTLAPRLTESQRETLSEKRTELAQLQFNLDLATRKYYNLLELGSGIQSLTDEQRETLSEKQTELGQLQFDLDLATSNYNALAQAGLGNQFGDTSAGRADQQQATLALYQQIYSTLLNNYESVRLARLQTTPNVVQVEQATPPIRPVEPRLLTNVALGAAVGLLVMAGIAFVIEYLDDTLKTPRDVAHSLGLPIIGYVADVPGLKKPEKQPYVATHPRSQVSESFRILKTNLELIAKQKKLKTILFASSGAKEGKTTVATNLAVVMAQGNRRTILLDSDLRSPQIHTLMNMPNAIGLSDILQGNVELSDVIWTQKDEELGIITSGKIPSNPTELLSSPEMTQLLSQLKQLANMVIIDGPPLMVADATVLAAVVDGVVLVLRPGHTPVDAAQAMLEQFERAGARMVGVVFNRIPRKRADYFGSYRHHYLPEYYDQMQIDAHDGQTSTDGKSGRRLWPFRRKKA
ncbi:MAG: polysaccharide biosynthesis tyrosine autokinase [Anaerolineae bacterium]|nr:MAG: polysaccharide biosynthesis tyrosine autokinase [Anaerolineae bacterium]